MKTTLWRKSPAAREAALWRAAALCGALMLSIKMLQWLYPSAPPWNCLRPYEDFWQLVQEHVAVEGWGVVALRLGGNLASTLLLLAMIGCTLASVALGVKR